MGILIMVGQLILALTILVTIHELGHFLAARLFKIRVDKFYLFFDFLFPMANVMNFALFKKKVGDTEYGIGWFPFGGYVAINGMVDETTLSDQLASEPQPYEYRAKPHWQKIIVILGGIIFNIILGIMIYAMWLKTFQKEYLPLAELNKYGISISAQGDSLGFKNGDKIIKVNGVAPQRYDDLFPISIAFGGYYTIEREEGGNVVEKDIHLPENFYKQVKGAFFEPKYVSVKVAEISSKSPAKKAGLMKNDILVAVDHHEYTDYEMFRSMMDSNINKTITLTVLRENQRRDIVCTTDSNGKIGFMPGIVLNKEKYQMHAYTFMESLSYGFKESFKAFLMQAVGISKIVSGKIPAKDNVRGFGSMAEAFGEKWDWSWFWRLTGIISMALAFMNLLPIPGLDGGHFVIILYEWISGRTISLRVLDILQRIGTGLIFALLIYANFNDIIYSDWFSKLFGK